MRLNAACRQSGGQAASRPGTPPLSCRQQFRLDDFATHRFACPPLAVRSLDSSRVSSLQFVSDFELRTLDLSCPPRAWRISAFHFLLSAFRNVTPSPLVPFFDFCNLLPTNNLQKLAFVPPPVFGAKRCHLDARSNCQFQPLRAWHFQPCEVFRRRVGFLRAKDRP
jgi:hypothetical protein